MQTLFKYFNDYMESEARELDVLICDEAHRIRETGVKRYTPRRRLGPLDGLHHHLDRDLLLVQEHELLPLLDLPRGEVQQRFGRRVLETEELVGRAPFRVPVGGGVEPTRYSQYRRTCSTGCSTGSRREAIRTRSAASSSAFDHCFSSTRT
ncbi:hypothetical protein [Amycolatopsis methanolica]|uniref:hypothetical protein n=1 Tax=Amycolatopsis methanolica TaxID=1814 RepID=UPI0003828E3E|nr:hypothetical protein [Amycolatopsis methanolica]